VLSDRRSSDEIISREALDNHSAADLRGRS
jgi:hypothetical protein